MKSAADEVRKKVIDIDEPGVAEDEIGNITISTDGTMAKAWILVTEWCCHNNSQCDR